MKRTTQTLSALMICSLASSMAMAQSQDEEFAGDQFMTEESQQDMSPSAQSDTDRSMDEQMGQMDQARDPAMPGRSATAQSDQGDQAMQRGGEMAQVQGYYKTEDIIGHKVVGDNGNELGTIEELVFDSQGKISHFVLSRGGFLGFNETKLLVPWSVLGEIDKVSGSYIVPLNNATMETAPTLSQQDMDNLTSPALVQQSDRYFRAGQFKEQGMASRLDDRPLMQKFSRYDKDRNNQLSREEAQQAEAGLASNFEDIDSDGDGVISQAEYARYAVDIEEK